MAQQPVVSGVVSQQIPDFIRGDHPNFVRFVELYYQWLEDSTKGNTVYQIASLPDYRDIDTTPDPFVRLFKEELLPFFPEVTALDTVKILKGAREFYAQKGNEASLKWLFRVLFNQEIEIYYPKKQILKASDGKWKLPLAFRLTLSPENINIDPNKLEKLLGEGSISKARCRIESAAKTIDKNFGTEIIEIYVSGVEKEFQNGEFLIIYGVEGYDDASPFQEKIIGSISNIRIDSNIKTDPSQKRRGLLYNVGDPVVVFGGLNEAANSSPISAEAYVYEVTQGSIEGISVSFPGYGYRTFYNAMTTVVSSPADDPLSNSSTNVVVSVINTDSTGNSQTSFYETIEVDKMPLEYLANVTLSNTDYGVLSTNNRCIVLTVTNAGDPWYPGEYCYANGNSYATANFTGKILTSNAGWAGGPGTLIIHSVQNTVPLSTSGFLVGTDLLITTNSATTFTVNSLDDANLKANINSTLEQVLVYETIDTGGISFYSVVNGGYGFRTVPQLVTTPYYDTYWSEEVFTGDPTAAEYAARRQPLSATGKIAHLYIDNGGAGYANGDTITVTGRGYGFSGYVNVDSDGKIVNVTITNRGEGYSGVKTVHVNNAAPITANATLSAYNFGEGVEYGIDTSAIGRVQSIKVSNRGYDYISTPTVSLKVGDIVVDAIAEGDQPYVEEGNIIYQGDVATPTFRARIKNYDHTTSVLRVFDYFGSFDPTATITAGRINADGDDESLGYVVSLNTAATVPAPAQYPSTVIASGLPNPFFYGNGKAKAVADFFNGLIKFNGFYVNTDGFVSSDKRLQDGKTYHNYSYVIESQKSLADYKNVIGDIAHPIGTSMLSRTIVYNPSIKLTFKANSDVYKESTISTTSNVQIANARSNAITGNNTTFASNAVGNLINIIDLTYPLRSRAKTVIKYNSATSIEVEGNFVDLGQGRLGSPTKNVANSDIIASVSGKLISRNGTITTSATNTRVSVTETRINGKANVYSINTTVNGVNTNFDTELADGDLIRINNQIKSVVNVASATKLTVNSAFTANSNSRPAFRLTANLRHELALNDFIYVNGIERKVASWIDESAFYVGKSFGVRYTDATYFKINNSPSTANVTRTSGTTIAGSGIKINDLISVNNEIRRVIATDSSVLVTNAPFLYTATGQNVIRYDQTSFAVSGNANAISDFIAVGDTLTFNISAYSETFRATALDTGTALTANITTGSNVVFRGTGFNFSTQTVIKPGDVVTINNETRTVLSSNNIALNCNAAFTTTAVANALLYKAKTLDANVLAISGDTITTNVGSLISNVSGLIYFVTPNYSTRDYVYKFVTLE